MTAIARLYDHLGRPLRPRALERAYSGAGSGRRSAHWNATNESINALLAGSLATLRGRARDVVRKSPWAVGIERFVDSAIGTGIRPLPLITDAGLRRKIIEAFEHWAMNECDADGRASFYGLQEIAAREVREVGEVFTRLRARSESDMLSVPLQIQLLESEQCDEGLTRVLSTQREVKLGVEFDRLGRRRAYWMFERHPGDVNYSWTATSAIERRAIPADAVLHVFDVMRAGQVRGIPPIVVLLSKFKDLTEVDDAYGVKQKVAALFAGFIIKPSEESNPLGTIPEETDDQDVPLITLEPGLLQDLLPGEDVKFASPPQGSEEYVSWFRDQLRTLAAGQGVMYEMMTGDLTGVTYSSIRTGIIWHRRAIQRWQANVMVRQFCNPIWRRWYSDAVLSGELPLVQDTRDGIPRVRWIPTPGWAQVDPEKETRSIEREIRAGLATRSQKLIESAVDPEEFDDERARENERADALELIYDSDPRVTNQSGGLQGTAAPPPPPRPEIPTDGGQR